MKYELEMKTEYINGEYQEDYNLQRVFSLARIKKYNIIS